MHKRLLTALCVVLATLGGTYGQTCDATRQLTDNVVLPVTGITCIECVSGGAVQTLVQWSVSGTTLVGGENGIMLESGRLVISDANMFITGFGGAPVSVACETMLGTESEMVYIEGLFDPVVTTVMSTVNEGGDVTLVCSNTNAPGTVLLEWLDPQGVVVFSFTQYRITNVQRAATGTYTCRFTLQANNTVTKSNSVDITVNYAPGIVSGSESTGLVPLGGSFTLTCTWDSVPDSVVTWFQNSMLLTNGDANVIINDVDKTSTLVINPIAVSSGGTYRCTATNSLDSAQDEVMRTIQLPPSTATALMVSNPQVESLDLSWVNGFNGLSEITGVQIILRVQSLIVETRDIAGDSTLQSTSLTSLEPFTMYTIELRVMNAVGLSLPASINGMTLSLDLGAPRMLTLISNTSTTLLLNWMPPIPIMASTSPPTNWTLELFDSNDVVIRTNIIQDAATTEFTFEGLEKGVTYSARVAGSNVRGLGSFSPAVTSQTIVDPPTVPQNLVGMGISAFGFTIDWDPPMDNGGRPVTEYIVSYINIDNNNMGSLRLTVTELLLRNGGTPMPSLPLINSTMYRIEVQAVNEADSGAAATITVTTQSIDDPQPIFDEPESATITNLTATVSWVNPGGFVTFFNVQYKLTADDWSIASDVVEVMVPGNMTSVLLTDLIPDADYDVRIRTTNNLGSSEFSIEISFSTLPPDPPIINGPDMANVGQTTQLNCSSSLDIPELPLGWYRIIADSGENMMAALPESARVVGDDLVFTNPITTDSGIYACRLGSVGAQHAINFIAEIIENGGISMEVIIIVAVIGGVAVLVFLFVLILACYCTCCTSSSKNEAYNVKSSAKGKDKRSKAGRSRNNWIETSTKFVPNTTPSYARAQDEPSPFDIPDDLTTHASFNTLEKQNRIKQGENSKDLPARYGSSNV